MIFLSEMLEQELDKDSFHVEVCSSFLSANSSDLVLTTPTVTTQPTSAIQKTMDTPTTTSGAADHTHFLIVLAVYISSLSLVFVVFFRTEYKRTKANATEENVKEGKDNLGLELEVSGIKIT